MTEVEILKTIKAQNIELIWIILTLAAIVSMPIPAAITGLVCLLIIAVFEIYNNRRGK